jgi:hypothetical protein
MYRSPVIVSQNAMGQAPIHLLHRHQGLQVQATAALAAQALATAIQHRRLHLAHRRISEKYDGTMQNRAVKV